MLQLLFAMQLDWLPLRGDLSRDPAATATVTGFLTDRQPARRPLGCFRRCAAASGAAGRSRCRWAASRRSCASPAPACSTRCRRTSCFYERAMGYRGWRLIWIYVLRNSIIATVTQIGLLFGGADRRRRGGRGDLRLAGHRQLHRAGDPDRRLQGDAGGDAADRRRSMPLVNILVDVVHGLLDPRLREQG